MAGQTAEDDRFQAAVASRRRGEFPASVASELLAEVLDSRGGAATGLNALHGTG